MLTTAVAETMGRKVAAVTRVPRERETKLAQAVVMLVKKAGAWGQAASGAIPLLKKLAPWLGGLGLAGAGGYALKSKLGAKPEAGAGDGLLTAAGEPTGPTSLAGAGAGAGGGKRQPLFGGYAKKMLGRMNYNPTEATARQEAMRDITAGGSLRRQAHEERLQAIRSMFVQ